MGEDAGAVRRRRSVAGRDSGARGWCVNGRAADSRRPTLVGEAGVGRGGDGGERRVLGEGEGTRMRTRARDWRATCGRRRAKVEAAGIVGMLKACVLASGDP